MGDELGNATYINRLIVSTLSRPIYHLDRERPFLELSNDFECQNVGKKTTKMLLLRFGAYIGELVSDSPTVWTSKCTIVPWSVSTPNLKWLTIFYFNNLYRLFGWPSSWSSQVTALTCSHLFMPPQELECRMEQVLGDAKISVEIPLDSLPLTPSYMSLTQVRLNMASF